MDPSPPARGRAQQQTPPKTVRAGLPEIPVIDLGDGGALALFEAERERALALLAAGRGRFPAWLLRSGEGVSAAWLARSRTPYLAELHALAAALPGPGALLLNTSYEWACTGAVGPAPAGQANRLLRVLDWPFDGLGRHVVAARLNAPAGPWVNLTWPGFVGTIQGLAPGRFAAALNQAPMARLGGPRSLDWAISRWQVWRKPAMPPAHLLRQVFEEAPDYRIARRMLIQTPVALPVIFLLSGLGPKQGCIIERYGSEVKVIDAPATAANHWQAIQRRGRPRGELSHQRARQLAARRADAGEDLGWLAPPVLNETTRLAMVAEAATGRLSARGYEADGPATRTLRLEAA